MSKRRRELTSDETKLWRRVAEGVKPRRPLPPEPEDPPSAPRAAVKSATPGPAPVRAGKPPTRAGAAAPANRVGEKRVRRGRLEIGATLDLHGHTLTTAQTALTRFLALAHARGDRVVIVVTGVGRGGEGVLRRMLPEWLAAQGVRALIAGYAPAHRSHGGAGAFYVFLKRSAGEL